jgi:prevent-host-death family protein
MLRTIQDRRVRGIIAQRIDALAYEPDKQGRALLGELAGYRSVRAVGQRYRIIYQVNQDRVEVVVIALGLEREGSRRDIYSLAQRLIRLDLYRITTINYPLSNIMVLKMALNDIPDTISNIPITEARNILTRLPEQLAEEHAAIALTRRGKPVMALMSWELYEAIMETLEIMGDSDLMTALRQSVKEASEGKVTPWETVKAELNL